MGTNVENKERYFSIELKSKVDLKNIIIATGSQDSVLIEGTIGLLQQAVFVEGLILEIIGEKGTLRINLEAQELKKEPSLNAAPENVSIDCSCKTNKPQSNLEEVNRCKYQP